MQKGREDGALFTSRTEVQNASMAGIRIHLHTLHKKIGKTEAGMDSNVMSEESDDHLLRLHGIFAITKMPFYAFGIV
jgi:hypothetical protein